MRFTGNCAKYSRNYANSDKVRHSVFKNDNVSKVCQSMPKEEKVYQNLQKIKFKSKNNCIKIWKNVGKSWEGMTKLEQSSWSVFIAFLVSQHHFFECTTIFVTSNVKFLGMFFALFNQFTCILAFVPQ